MLRSILERGNPMQREWALQTLIASERFRGRREALGALPLGAPAGQKYRAIYDAQGNYGLPGRLVRTEGDPATKDPAVNEAYEGSGATYDLYQQVFGRVSIDDHGMRLESSVHYGKEYDNAFWDGKQMVYGDGDGEFFERFTKAVDVIGHELTHGVTQYEANLDYSRQSGALNESFSDVFGSLVKQRLLKQTVRRTDWLIGQGLFSKKVRGMALRSLKAPGTAYDDPVLGRDPQPAHMENYLQTDQDNGGVHINSGIPNHAFYMIAMEIGGYAWEKAGRIWYTVLKGRLKRHAQFESVALMTYQVAGELYGTKSREQKAVRKGWKEVGILV